MISFYKYKLLPVLFFQVILFKVIFFSSSVFAAACCGGGSAVPSLVTSDDSGQISVSLSNQQVFIDSVDGNGIWIPGSSHQKTQNVKVDWAQIINDLYQVGLTANVMQRSRGSSDSEKSSQLGDVVLSSAYEFLPDWDYNPWRPKGFGFLQVTLPTGKSKYESERGGLDSSGLGLFSMSIGTLLTKSWNAYDILVNMEAHQAFEKTITTSTFKGRVRPNLGGSWGLGAGYNWENWRWGTQVLWVYEGPTSLKGEGGYLDQKGAIERYANFILSASYMINDEWSSSLTYSDQTFFGAPINTSLSKGIGFLLQKRWKR